MKEMEGGFLPETAPDNTSQRAASHDVTRSVQQQLPNAPIHDASAHITTGCSRCSSLTFSKEFYDAFGVTLCAECRRSEKLISKTNAKAQYCLTDGDIKKLGSLRRPNPHNKTSWSAMQLLLQSQVEAVAIAKHGSLENITVKQHELLDKKLQSRLRKRDEDKTRQEEEEASLQRIKRRIAEEHTQKVGTSIDVEDVDVEEI